MAISTCRGEPVKLPGHLGRLRKRDFGITSTATKHAQLGPPKELEVRGAVRRLSPDFVRAHVGIDGDSLWSTPSLPRHMGVITLGPVVKRPRRAGADHDRKLQRLVTKQVGVNEKPEHN